MRSAFKVDFEPDGTGYVKLMAARRTRSVVLPYLDTEQGTFMISVGFALKTEVEAG